jgi:hypothetical protein
LTPAIPTRPESRTRRARTAFLLTLALALLVAPGRARATGRDFLDETMIGQGLKPGESGFEFAIESRLDAQNRTQSWFCPAFEASITRNWLIEGVGEFLNRGEGIEWGGWRAESRYTLLRRESAPLDLAFALEYEFGNTNGKLFVNEEALIWRAVLTREVVPGLLATANLGSARTLTGTTRSGFAWGFGVRYPEDHAFMAGLEVDREPLEKSTRIVPQVWLKLPDEFSLRLGGVIGTHARPYKFILRAIIEKDLEF